MSRTLVARWHPEHWLKDDILNTDSMLISRVLAAELHEVEAAGWYACHHFQGYLSRIDCRVMSIADGVKVDMQGIFCSDNQSSGCGWTLVGTFRTVAVEPQPEHWMWTALWSLCKLLCPAYWLKDVILNFWCYDSLDNDCSVVARALVVGWFT